jgi:hypothetical protein
MHVASYEWLGNVASVHFTIAVREQAGSNAAIPLQLATLEQAA